MRVRSNFIPVGKPAEDTSTPTKPDRQSEWTPAEPIVSKNIDESPKKEDVSVIEKDVPVAKAEESEKLVPIPALPITNGSEGSGKQVVRETPNGSSKRDKPEAPVELVKPEKPAESPVAVVKESKPISTTKPQTPIAKPPPHKTPPTKTVTPSPRVISTPKRPTELAWTPKSPPTPKETPPSSSAKASPPRQKKTVGPLSPAKSTSTRRSSSPFLPSPTGFSKSTPKKDTPAANVPGAQSRDRKVSTPKTLTAPVKSTPKSAAQPTPKPITKVSPAPKTRGVTPKPTASTPLAARPRSAQSEVATPSPSRRIVSHPPRPSTAASNKPSPKVHRTASMQSLPRKPVKSEQPPVPPLPHVVPSSSTSDMDYSHLPAFMRPTQASSAKVVPRPTSAMEKRSHSGSFKV